VAAERIVIMELVIGHGVVFVLAAICQISWLSRGQRNTSLSAILTLAVGIIGVAVLGWLALVTAIVGAIMGPVLARLFASPVPVEAPAAQSQEPARASADVESDGHKFEFTDKPKNIVSLFDEGRPTPKRIAELRDWVAKGAPGADYELACAILLVDPTSEGLT
jgi:hypothetical protein